MMLNIKRSVLGAMALIALALGLLSTQADVFTSAADAPVQVANCSSVICPD